MPDTTPDPLAIRLDKLIYLGEQLLSEMRLTRAQLAKVEAALAAQAPASQPAPGFGQQTATHAARPAQPATPADPAKALAQQLIARNRSKTKQR